MTTLPAYGISLTSTIASLDSLGLPIPKADPVDYAVYVNLGDGTQRGMGWLTCAWRFAALTLAQVTTLQTYAGACYIRTLTEAGTYVAYSAKAILPRRKSPKVDTQHDYVVVFRSLVAV
jgi:hypothetical protein